MAVKKKNQEGLVRPMVGKGGWGKVRVYGDLISTVERHEEASTRKTKAVIMKARTTQTDHNRGKT